MKLLFSLMMAAALWATSAGAEQAPMLKEIKAFKKGEVFVTELIFDREIESQSAEVEYINQTVQVNIPGARMGKGKSKDLVRVEDDKVKSVFTYQANNELLRSRIIYHPPFEASELKGHVFLTKSGRQLTVEVRPEGTVASATDEKTELPVIAPVDLNAELDKALSVAESESEDINLIREATEIVQEELEVEPVAKAKTKPLKESEIPVLTSTKADKGKGESPWLRLVISLAVIGVVASVMILFARQRMSKSDKSKPGTKINIVAQHHLGPKKSLAIVQVAGESILIGVTDHAISHIRTLSLLDDDLPQDIPDDFGATLNQQDQEIPVQHPLIQAKQEPSKEIIEDEFSISSIKDMVSSKLKEMRSI